MCNFLQGTQMTNMTSCKQRLPAMDFVYSCKSNVLFMCYVYVTVCVLFTSSVLYKDVTG